MKKVNIYSQIGKDEKGVALIWSLITISVLLVMTTSMANLMIDETRMSTSIDGSTRAYAAAESGIEHGTYLTKNNSCSNLNSQVISEVLDATANSNYEVEFADCAMSGSILIGVTVISTGKSGNITRKIEKKIDKSTSVQPNVGVYDSNPGIDARGSRHPIGFIKKPSGASISSINTTKNSYTQIVNFRLSGNFSGSGPVSAVFGLINVDGLVITGAIDEVKGYGYWARIKKDGGVFYLEVPTGDTLKVNTDYDSIPINDPEIDNGLEIGKTYILKMDYTRDNSFTAKLETQGGECVGVMSKTASSIEARWLGAVLLAKGSLNSTVYDPLEHLDLGGQAEVINTSFTVK